MMIKDNQCPSVTCLLPCPGPLDSHPLLFSHSLPRNPATRNYLKHSTQYARLHSEAFRIKCRLLSFACKSFQGLCQTYHFIFISECSLLTIPEELTVPQTGHLLSSLVLLCYFLCPEAKEYRFWSQEYFYLNIG